LPPSREINHEIKFTDETKQFYYRLPKCPEFARYPTAGWWVSASVRSAAPALCILEKNGKLRTAIDLHLRTDNTVKDITPFPDQNMIWHNVACAAYQSKLDMSDAYKQIRIVEEDI
ncbi:hypothetical protein K439DRAFT_1275008, partial [Ramaria rubella]